MAISKVLVGLCVAALAGAASADPLHPVSYEMPNGQTGQFTYWDDSYNGNGDTTSDGAYLTGGLGDLTDGVIATENWFSTPQLYVGWDSITPTITFNFADSVKVDSITLHLDDSNGAGGVTPPGRILLEWATGSTAFSVDDPDSGAPFALTLSNLGIEASQIQITLYDGTEPWVFCSEIEFNAVPAPAAASLAGLAAVAGLRRRR